MAVESYEALLVIAECKFCQLRLTAKAADVPHSWESCNERLYMQSHVIKERVLQWL